MHEAMKREQGKRKRVASAENSATKMRFESGFGLIYQDDHKVFFRLPGFPKAPNLTRCGDTLCPYEFEFRADGVLECPWWVRGVVAESEPHDAHFRLKNRDFLVT